MYYLNLCHYGGEWSPLALYRDGGIVGSAMWGVDGSEGSHWIDDNTRRLMCGYW